MLSSIYDFFHAARTLARARAFTAVCVISLGLGMGVVIAIVLMMRTLVGTPPGVDDDGLVELRMGNPRPPVFVSLAQHPASRILATAVQPIVAMRSE